MVCAVYYTLCVAVASEHGTVEMKKTSGPSCTVTKSSSEWGGKNGPTPTLPVVTFLPLVAKKKQEDRRRACALRHLVVMESSCTQPAALYHHTITGGSGRVTIIQKKQVGFQPMVFS